MSEFILSLLSILAFSLCLHFLLLSVSQNLRLQAMVGHYSMRALKVERGYKIFAWGVLAIFFFVTSLVMTIRMVALL